MYLEFGVYEGESILYFSKLNSDRDNLFYGFDCFEGLPDDWRLTGGKMIDKGTFGVGGNIPKTEDHRIHFIKGYFQKTLIPFIQ